RPRPLRSPLPRRRPLTLLTLRPPGRRQAAALGAAAVWAAEHNIPHANGTKAMAGRLAPMQAGADRAGFASPTPLATSNHELTRGLRAAAARLLRPGNQLDTGSQCGGEPDCMAMSSRIALPPREG